MLEQSFWARSCSPYLKRFVCSAVLLGAVAATAFGQGPPAGPPQWTTLPEVELAPRREASKDDAWAVPADEEDARRKRATVSDFVDSLRGNDAAIKVIVGQSRLLTTEKPLASEQGTAVIAVGDPTVIDFDVLPNAKMIRLVGRRVGVTDLTYVGADGQSYAFEVNVLYDLDLLTAQLRQHFPDALVRLGQIREHVVVEGQARSTAQVQSILNTISVYLLSAQTPQSSQGNQPQGGGGAGSSEEDARGNRAAEENTESEEGGEGGEGGEEQPADEESAPGVVYEEGGRASTRSSFAQPQIINLLQVPGVHQVMLKVQLAELNRRALREIGADLTYISGGTFLQSIASGGGNLVGVFNGGEFTIVLNALRRNDVARVLAEPNLVTLSGHTARFLSGGEFPVPVAQQGGGAGNNRVEFKPFGVQLAFIPYVQDTGLIRLRVEPEVSTIDEQLSVSLIIGGDPIPGLRTRNASTTVELREGQTLAIAGLLNYESEGQTSRVPLLGDLPYIGPLFSNTRHEVLEQELLVAVTPYLISPSDACQPPPLPGTEILEPNDLEFYLLNRIEGRTGYPFRSTAQWDNPFSLQRQRQYEQSFIYGPVGQSN